MDKEFFSFSHTGFDPESFKKFLVYAYKHEVSDIHITGGCKIVVGLYGRLQSASNIVLDNQKIITIIDQVFNPEVVGTVISGHSVDRALKLDGGKTQRYGLNDNETVRFRFNFTQGTAGDKEQVISITIRVIPNEIPLLKDLNIESDLMESLLPHKGIGLVCGETNSGKSTLLASTYRHCCDNYAHRKIITLEDPIEYIIGKKSDILPPVQSELGRDFQNFGIALNAAMRRAPSIIGVGEIRDSITLESAIKCSKSGHLCLSTMHTDSPGLTIPRALDLVPVEIRESTAYGLLDALQFIVVQRLLKTTNGKRCAVREYIIFDDVIKSSLNEIDYKKWAFFIDSKIKEEKRSIKYKAINLYQEGIIDKLQLLEVITNNEFNEMVEKTL